MRALFGILWFLFIGSVLFTYFFYPDIFQNQLDRLAHTSIYLTSAILLILGALRGFTLIPITNLIIIGVLFIPPLPLLIVILIGALISSTCVYYFFKFLNLDELFEKKHGKQIEKVRQALVKNELPIIIAWSAIPFLPTDVICYICGTLEVDIKKLLLGVFIGEGITCTIYIYFGSYLLDYLHLVL